MARILIADNAKGICRLQSMLAEKHRLFFAENLSDALKIIIKERLDMVIVGIHFDESRMYQLITELRKMEKMRKTIVIGFCDVRTPVSSSIRDVNETTSHLLGMSDYIDTKGMSDDEILERIETCFKEQHGLGDKRKITDETPAVKRKKQEEKREKK